MRSVLLISDPADAHARIVSCALNFLAIKTIRFFPKDFLLMRKQHTTYIHENGSLQSIYEQEDWSHLTSVWFRRVGTPLVPKDTHPHDNLVIHKENTLYMHSLWATLSNHAFWVNPYDAGRKAQSKLLQLQLAAQVGLTIPETLASNHRKEIEHFILKNAPQKTIYKTFFPASFTEDSKNLSSFTNIVELEHLPSEHTLLLTPGIYQKYIPKQYEIRATFFGDHCLAVKLTCNNKMDWRDYSKANQLQIIPYELPKDLHIQCVHLMKKLGIIFGCFDFICTPEGKFVFLEVNEMGQFLWIEEHAPQIPMLDTFCHFLLQGSVVKERPLLFKLKDIEHSSEYKVLLEHDRSLIAFNKERQSLIQQEIR